MKKLLSYLNYPINLRLKWLFFLLSIGFLFSQQIVFADYCEDRVEGGESSLIPFSGSIVPCGLSCDYEHTPYDETDPCTLCHFILLLKNVYNFLFSMIIIASLILITIGGVMYIVSTGNASLKSRGKAIITKVISGFLVAMLSWVIVYTILWFLSANDTASFSSVEGGAFNFECDLKSKFVGEYQTYQGRLAVRRTGKVGEAVAGLNGARYSRSGHIIMDDVSTDELAAQIGDQTGVAMGEHDNAVIYGFAFRGIKEAQTAHISFPLRMLLKCMSDNEKLPKDAKVITSISNDSIVNRGENICEYDRYDSNACAHSRGSKHYGGKNSACYNGIDKFSLAVDFGQDAYAKELAYAALSCAKDNNALNRSVEIDENYTGWDNSGRKLFILDEGNHIHMHLNVKGKNGKSCSEDAIPPPVF